MDYSKSPQELAKSLSLQKAQEVAKRHEDALILAADTFVVVDGKYLGKPKDRQEAEDMLSFQSGKKQKVVTGFTIIDTSTNKTVTGGEVSLIWFRTLSTEQIAQYLDKNTYLDKAGSYALQEVGESFIEKIEGDRDSIIGLPLKKVLTQLQEF